MNKRNKTIALHVTAWILFLLYEWLFKQGVLNNPETFVFNLKIVAIRVMVLIPTVYFTLYFLVPYLLLKGRKILFIISLIGTIAAAAFVMKTLNYFLVLRGVEGFASSYSALLSGLTGWLIFMGNIAFNVSFALMFYFIHKWMQDDKKRQELEAAKKEAELGLLKSQVQPHFIFNTINNIYALSKQSDPKTTEMIYRLSVLLEYMLYDSNRELTFLTREMNYIENYLELEKIRYGQRLDISFNTYGNIGGLEVPPLILLPFVENSFKHGLSQQTADCWLQIEISYEDPWLKLKVENSKSKEEIAPARKGGLGITNVRKRLDILMDGAYELKQLNGTDSYLVTLKIKLKPKMRYDTTARPLEVPGSR